MTGLTTSLTLKWMALKRVIDCTVNESLSLRPPLRGREVKGLDVESHLWFYLLCLWTSNQTQIAFGSCSTGNQDGVRLLKQL